MVQQNVFRRRHINKSNIVTANSVFAKTDVVIVVDSSNDARIRTGDKYVGIGMNDKGNYDYMRRFTWIGNGVCSSKNKCVALYVDGDGNVVGLSNFKSDRFFVLQKVN